MAFSSAFSVSVMLVPPASNIQLSLEHINVKRASGWVQTDIVCFLLSFGGICLLYVTFYVGIGYILCDFLLRR